MVPGRRLRIAYGRIAQETNAFSPVPCTLEDFRRFHWVEGSQLDRITSRWGAEVPGMIRNAELSGFRRAVRRHGLGQVEPVPLFSAWAMPGGPLSQDAYDELRERLVRGLREAGPLDAVFLTLHGAMRGGSGLPEPEEGFLAAVREVVGPDVPVAITLDLHGQLTPAKVDPATILCAYRTNPHRDLYNTGYRAAKLLLETLRGQVRPVSRWRSLPMLMGGGMTMDFLQPMRGVFRRMKAMERRPGVLSVSLFMVHLFNDSPDLGWSCHVTTDGDEALADRVADELAELAWGVRHHRPPPFLEASEGIEAVRRARLARKTGTVCVADVSDVVGAGGTGENTNLLRALLDEGQGLRAYLPLRDPVAVEQLWGQTPGAAVELDVGGRLHPEVNPAVRVRGRLATRKATQHFGRVAVVDCDHVQLVLTELPPLPLKPRFYSDVGLNPWQADLVVVKNFFHYRVYYALLHRKTVPIRTRGITDLELVLERQGFNDPVFPRDDVPDWRDASRRRLAAAGA